MRDADLAPPPSALDHAQRRLDRALETLEARARAMKAPPRPVAAAPSAEQARLKDELEQAQHRERQLELVAAEASAALGRAAAEVRAALAAEG